MCRSVLPDERAATRQQPVERHVLDGEVENPRLELRVREHVVDDAEQLSLTQLNALEVPALFRRNRAAHAELQQLGVSSDRVEWRAELVAHHGEEVRFCANRGARLPLRGRQRARLERGHEHALNHAVLVARRAVAERERGVALSPARPTLTDRVFHQCAFPAHALRYSSQSRCQPSGQLLFTGVPKTVGCFAPISAR